MTISINNQYEICEKINTVMTLKTPFLPIIWSFLVIFRPFDVNLCLQKSQEGFCDTACTFS